MVEETRVAATQGAKIRSELDLLRLMRTKVAEYAGGNDLKSLHSYILGFKNACAVYGNEYDGGTPDLIMFTKWLAMKFHNRPAKGWERLIAEKVGVDGPEAVERFYSLLDEFLATEREG
jgi:hypothetical protein